MYLLLYHYILWYKGDTAKLYFQDNKIFLNCIYMRCILPLHTVIPSILKTNTTHYLSALVKLLIGI